MQHSFEKYYSIFDEATEEKKWEKISHEPSDAWVVLIDGERVVLTSRKSLWRKKQFASCALTNELKHIYFSHQHQLRGWEWWTVEKKVIKAWVNKHAEIITLSEWVKRGRP